MKKLKFELVRTAELSVLIIISLFLLSGCSGIFNFSQSKVDFSAEPRKGEAPLEVTFEAKLLTISEADIIDFEWDFGDGENGFKERLTHTFDDPGTYTVTLTVTDGQGNTYSNSRTISVTDGTNQPPSAQFDFDPSGGTAPLRVTFDASASTDPDGNISSYQWDFDGVKDSGQVVIHTFEYAGLYEVTLTVKDEFGVTDTYEKTIKVECNC